MKAGRRYRVRVPAQCQHPTPEDIYLAALDQASADYQRGVARVTAWLAADWHRKISEAARRYEQAATEEAA